MLLPLLGALSVGCIVPIGPLDFPDAGCSQPCSISTLATGQTDAFGLAVSNGELFWTTGNSGTVVKSDLDGGHLSVLATGNAFAAELAVDEDSVYWAEDTYFTGVTGRLLRVSRDGGEVDTIASGQSPRYGKLGIDPAFFYWPNLYGDADGGPSSVDRFRKDGGEVEQVALARNAAHSVLAADGGLFWSDFGAGLIEQALRDGGVATLASGSNEPTYLVSDGASLYWLNYGGGQVMSWSVGAARASTLAEGQVLLGDIGVDDQYVYWTDGDSTLDAGTHLWRIAKDGSGSPEKLATGQLLRSLIVTQDAVYWTDEQGGTIQRLLK